MNIIYSDQPIRPADFADRTTKELFLAGPSPRNGIGKNWRENALDIIEAEFIRRNIDTPLDVYVPLPSTGVVDDYEHQIEWEQSHLERSDAILFWVPRDLSLLPGFTTNVEFGQFVNRDMWKAYTGQMKTIVYGRPEGAPKTKYLDKLFLMHNYGPIETDLRASIVSVLNQIL